MNKAMRDKTVPLPIIYRWRIKNKPIKYCFVLPCHYADNNRDNNNKGRMIEQRKILRLRLICDKVMNNNVQSLRIMAECKLNRTDKQLLSMSYL